MADHSLYPLRFEPMFQYRPWGGRRLGEWMNKPLPGEDPIGEAWVLSDRPEHVSCVTNGPLKGCNLSALMSSARDDLLGDAVTPGDRFPLLLKFLDVREMLSVQVHPSDDQASRFAPGDRGKSEAWVVLEADPGSRIYAGLQPGVTEADLRGLSKASINQRLHGFDPEPGQGVMIEAGSVHALGDGVMVFEVQENSDITLRLYDWDRIDKKTGRPRDLQVDEALACIDFGRGPIAPVQPVVQEIDPVARERLFDDPHFHLWRERCASAFDVGAEGEMRILVCAEGVGEVAWAGGTCPLERGAVVLLPASLGVCTVRPEALLTLFEIAAPRQ